MYSSTVDIFFIVIGRAGRGDVWFVPAVRTTVSMVVNTNSSSASGAAGSVARCSETETGARSMTAGAAAMTSAPARLAAD